jgi:hypothetical protein
MTAFFLDYFILSTCRLVRGDCFVAEFIPQSGAPRNNMTLLELVQLSNRLRLTYTVIASPTKEGAAILKSYQENRLSWCHRLPVQIKFS